MPLEEGRPSLTDVPREDGDMAPVDDPGDGRGAREGESTRNFSKKKLMEEFRAAVPDERKLERLVAEAGNHPVDVWSKALLWAASSDQAELIFQFRMRAPPSMRNLLRTARDGDGFTALHRAIVGGRKRVVELLTQSGLESSSTPKELFEVLQARTPEGWTALHLAVVSGDEPVVKILIDAYDSAEAPPASDWDMADNLWMTPLHYAVLSNSLPMMDQLLQWPGYYRYVNARDYYLRTPLHMANGHRAICALIEHDAVDVNAVDCCLFSPLHWFVYVGATDAVQCLLSFADKRTVRTTEEDVQGRPVFQIAIENWNLDSKVRKDIEKLLLTSAGVRDEIETLYRDRQVYVDAANAILVGAALIASVTFGGWLQPPQGDGSGQSQHNKRVFWAANSLSFFFSIATVVTGAGAVLPMEHVYIGRSVRSIRQLLALTSFLLIMSVIFVLVAFGASGFVAQSNVPKLKVNMAVTTAIGSLACAVVLALFLHRLYRIGPDLTEVMRDCKKWREAVARKRRGWDLVEIQEKLEAAQRRVWEEESTGKRKGGHPRERPRANLDDVVVSLRRASETAVEVGWFARKGLHFDDGKEQGFWNRWFHGRHLRKDLQEQQILAFENAYERARIPTLDKGRVQNPSLNMLILNHVSNRGLHYWIDGFSVPHCRANVHQREIQRWDRVHERVCHQKLPNLFIESDKFEYGLLGFDDWAA